MNKKIYQEHYETVIGLIRALGIEGTDDYFSQEHNNILKQISNLKEKIIDMRGSIQHKNNSDELLHLKYDIEDLQNHLNNMFNKLKMIEESYSYFKEHIKNKV